jgi:dihydrodipicolinate synthase/N-acetylneuraminate lyase
MKHYSETYEFFTQMDKNIDLPTILYNYVSLY